MRIRRTLIGGSAVLAAVTALGIGAAGPATAASARPGIPLAHHGSAAHSGSRYRDQRSLITIHDSAVQCPCRVG